MSRGTGGNTETSTTTAGGGDPVVHGGEISTSIAKPLPSFHDRERSDQEKIHPIVGLDDVAFRAAHAERFQLLGVMPRTGSPS